MRDQIADGRSGQSSPPSKATGKRCGKIAPHASHEIKARNAPFSRCASEDEALGAVRAARPSRAQGERKRPTPWALSHARHSRLPNDDCDRIRLKKLTRFVVPKRVEES